MQNPFSFLACTNQKQYWIQLILLCGLSAVAALFSFILIASPLILLGGVFSAVVGFVLLWLAMALFVRRCRDAKCTPMVLLCLFVPLFGLIMAIVLGCLPTKQ